VYVLEECSCFQCFDVKPSLPSSESSVEVENRGEQVRWYLSSFAPPYVKGVDSSGDVYRATYTAFRCPRVSGTLGAYHKMQVITPSLPLPMALLGLLTTQLYPVTPLVPRTYLY
jgi:hypothetical protein